MSISNSEAITKKMLTKLARSIIRFHYLSPSPTSMRPFFFMLSVVAVLIALPCDSSPGPSVPTATAYRHAG
jgi:hypothetical protein